jgi:hypothetical protein
LPKRKDCCSLALFLALPFTLLKSILRQKKNYGNSNISSPLKKYIIFKKNHPVKETKIILQDIIITL